MTYFGAERDLICVDCGESWSWRGGQVRKTVRCKPCQGLYVRRAEVRQHLEQLVVTERGGRLAEAAIAAAHHASSMSPSSAGPSSLSGAVHQLAVSGNVDEHVKELLLMKVAAAATLWASEIAGALDG